MIHHKQTRFLNGFILMILLLPVLVLFAQDTPEGEAPLSNDTPDFAATYHTITGNRVVRGTGTFPHVDMRSVSANGGLVTWVVGYLTPEGTLRFLFTTDTGQLFEVEYSFEDGSFFNMRGENSASGILWYSSAVDLPAMPDLSPLSHPVVTAERVIFVDSSGALNLLTHSGEVLLHDTVQALPDARPVVNSSGSYVAIYAEATNQRYVHGVLGDDLEAAALYVYDLQSGERLNRIALEGDEVFEGLSPIWADVDGDGAEKLITTVSNGAQGAQIRVYTREGALLATGDAIGRGGRWRHQLAWGAFGAKGEYNLVDVLTPHIGGVVEFYRYDGNNRLEIVASQAGYTSHVIGTRNLDMAVAADFNGDGQLELAIPDQSRTIIAGLQRGENGTVDEVWRFELDGARVISNLAAVHIPDSGIALAAGLDDGTLRVWLPER